MYSGHVVVFAKNRWSRAKKVVFGQSDCIRAKVFALGQNGLNRAKVVLFGQSGCILQKKCYIRKKWLYSVKSGCIRAR